VVLLQELCLRQYVELDGRRRAPTYDSGAKKIDYVFGSIGLAAAAGAKSVSTTMSDHRVYLGSFLVSRP
jgi:hypothetical protein